MAVFRRPTVAAVLVVLAAAPALAQTPPQRPERVYRGLFGGNGADPKNVQQLDLNVSVYGGYDDNALQESQGVSLDPRFQKSAGYGGGNVSLTYVRAGGRASMDVSAGTDYRYYPVVSEMTGFNSWAALAFNVKLTRRTTLRATEAVSYSPFYSFSSFGVPGGAGTITGTTADYSLVQENTTIYSSSAALDRRFTRRATGTIDYSLRYSDFQDVYQPLKDLSAGGSFSYRMTPRASWRLGYHYRRGDYGRVRSEFESRPVESHDLDIGLDWEKPLSRSRRTRLSVSTGSSIVRMYDYYGWSPTTSEDGTEVTVPPYRTHYLVTGRAGLVHEMGRSWTARLDYTRGVQYVEAFPEPFFSDSVTATLRGFAGARTRLDFSAAYTNGTVGVTSYGSPYDSYTASARMQIAANRWTALYVDYLFYHYRFNESLALPSGLGRGLDRNSVRGGVTLWLPLFR